MIIICIVCVIAMVALEVCCFMEDFKNDYVIESIEEVNEVMYVDGEFEELMLAFDKAMNEPVEYRVKYTENMLDDEYQDNGLAVPVTRYSEEYPCIFDGEVYASYLGFQLNYCVGSYADYGIVSIMNDILRSNAAYTHLLINDVDYTCEVEVEKSNMVDGLRFGEVGKAYFDETGSRLVELCVHPLYALDWTTNSHELMHAILRMNNIDLPDLRYERSEDDTDYSSVNAEEYLCESFGLFMMRNNKWAAKHPDTFNWFVEHGFTPLQNYEIEYINMRQREAAINENVYYMFYNCYQSSAVMMEEYCDVYAIELGDPYMIMRNSYDLLWQAAGVNETMIDKNMIDCVCSEIDSSVFVNVCMGFQESWESWIPKIIARIVTGDSELMTEDELKDYEYHQKIYCPGGYTTEAY